MPTLEEQGLTGSLKPRRRDDDKLLYRAYRLVVEARRPAILAILQSLESVDPGNNVDEVRARLKMECDKAIGAHTQAMSLFQWEMRQPN